MSALPFFADYRTQVGHFAFLAHAKRCKTTCYSPLLENGEAFSLLLHPHLFDKGANAIIDLTVSPKVKDKADPCHWHLILSTSGRIPIVNKSFYVKRVPLLYPALKSFDVVLKFVDRDRRLLNIEPARDFRGRLRSRWIIAKANMNSFSKN